MKKKFKRIDKNSILTGVCTGLEEYSGVDVVFWRLLFILLPHSVLAYLILSFISKKE